MTEIEFVIRRAQRADARAIHALIRRVHINPTALDWRRFWLACSPTGEMLACGQVKPHADGSRELASIAVQPEWQGRGLGSALIAHLMRENPPPLLLTCRASLRPYYARFGFQPVPQAQLPSYFRRIQRLAAWLRRLLPRMEELAILRHD